MDSLCDTVRGDTVQGDNGGSVENAVTLADLKGANPTGRHASYPKHREGSHTSFDGGLVLIVDKERVELSVASLTRNEVHQEHLVLTLGDSHVVNIPDRVGNQDSDTTPCYEQSSAEMLYM